MLSHRVVVVVLDSLVDLLQSSVSADSKQLKKKSFNLTKIIKFVTKVVSNTEKEASFCACAQNLHRPSQKRT